MSELWQSFIADNGGYVLSAYVIILGTISTYALWLHGRLERARRRREKVRLGPAGLD